MNTEHNQPDNPTNPVGAADPAANGNPYAPPAGAYTQPPVNSYAPPAGAYTQPPVNPYAPPAGTYTQPPVNPYAPPAGAYTQPPVNPYAPPYPQGYAGVPYPGRRMSKPRDLILAFIFAVLIFCLTDCLIWGGTPGVGFASGAVLLLTTAVWYLKPVWRQKSFYFFSLIVLFAAASVSFVLSADTGSKALTLLSLPVIYTCMLMEGMQLRAWTPGTFRSIADFCYTAFVTFFGQVSDGMYALFHREPGTGGKRSSGIGKALLGLLIALPLAAILLSLLANGDPAFQGMLSNLDFGKAPEKIVTLVFAIPLFIFLFSQLFSLPTLERRRNEESDKGLDPTVVLFFMVGISAVYVAYLFAQLAYFFNGFLGFLPEEFTYAEYARKGFFELTTVSVINIVIIILATALTRKTQGKLPLKVKLPSLFLCVFSLLLAATEIAKMKMYMDNYGLTRLRILTTVFMVFLSVVFIALIIHIFARRFPYLKVAVVAGMILIVAVNFVSVDRTVAEYNVQAYQSGVLKSVDVDTISELGDAAVPALLKLAQDSSPSVAKKAKAELYRRWNTLHEYGTGKLKNYDWRGYNTVSYQARQLLLDNSALFAGAK